MADPSQEQQIPKDERLKKENSYTYWVDKDQKKREHTPPKKLDEKEVQQLKEKEEQKSDGHSAWNTLGTWEEKKLKHEEVVELLNQGLGNLKTADGIAQFVKVSKLDGEVKIIVSRGKKRLGYDINFKVKYEGFGEYEGSKGKIQFNEFMDDGDFEFKVEAKGEENKEKCKASVKSSVEMVAKKIQEILSTLKN